ncbi:MAG: hypothetical protein ACK55I_07520, partial [bacterium]
MLTVFKSAGSNLTHIDKRRHRVALWDYTFFVVARGHVRVRVGHHPWVHADRHARRPAEGTRARSHAAHLLHALELHGEDAALPRAHRAVELGRRLAHAAHQDVVG